MIRALPVFVILYNPSIEVLEKLKNISSFCNLFIFDNSATDYSLYFPSNYYHSSKNNGIVEGFIWMSQQCKSIGCEYFIFFDQDTIFTKKTIDYINQHSLSYIGSKYLIHYTSEGKRKGVVDFIINSGTVYPVKLLELAEPIIRKYFVDAVDLAICVQAKKYGYTVFCCLAPEIDHFSQQGFRKARIFYNSFNYKLYPIDRLREFFSSHLLLVKDLIFEKQFYSIFYVVKVSLAHFFGQMRALILSKFEIS